MVQDTKTDMTFDEGLLGFSSGGSPVRSVQAKVGRKGKDGGKHGGHDGGDYGDAGHYEPKEGDKYGEGDKCMVYTSGKCVKCTV